MATHAHGFDAVASSSRPSASASGRGAFQRLTTTGARVAFALPFAVFGLFHLMNAEAMAGMVPVPGGVFWIYATGLALVAGSIGVLTKKLGAYAALGLAALLATFIVFVHVPGLGNPQMRQMATTNLLKDVSLLGAALTWAGLLRKEA